MAVTVVPVVDAAWEDVRTVFGTRGDPARCWCQFFKADPAAWKAQDVAGFERGLCEQVHADRQGRGAGPGLIAYEDADPVGWVAVEPRPAYPRILHSRLIEHSPDPVDAADVWFVSCFVVRVGHRRSGTATALLAGAVDHARRHGARVVEAFPVEAGPGTSSADLYHGPLPVFEKAGFEVVARPSEARAVVRLEL